MKRFFGVLAAMVFGAVALMFITGMLSFGPGPDGSIMIKFLPQRQVVYVYPTQEVNTLTGPTATAVDVAFTALPPGNESAARATLSAAVAPIAPTATPVPGDGIRSALGIDPRPTPDPLFMVSQIQLMQEAYVAEYGCQLHRQVYGSASTTNDNGYSSTWNGVWTISSGISWGDLWDDANIDTTSNPPRFEFSVSPCVCGVSDPSIAGTDTGKDLLGEAWKYFWDPSKATDFAGANTQTINLARRQALTMANFFSLYNDQYDFLTNVWGNKLQTGFEKWLKPVNIAPIVIVRPQRATGYFKCDTGESIFDENGDYIYTPPPSPTPGP